MTKREAAALDKRIEAIFYAKCSGIPINIMDISKVFQAGRAAAASGADMEAAVVQTVARLAVAS